jgi:hypothetical protein
MRIKITKTEKLMLGFYIASMALMGLSYLPMETMIILIMLTSSGALLGVSGSFFIWKVLTK